MNEEIEWRLVAIVALSIAVLAFSVAFRCLLDWMDAADAVNRLAVENHLMRGIIGADMRRAGVVTPRPARERSDNGE